MCVMGKLSNISEDLVLQGAESVDIILSKGCDDREYIQHGEENDCLVYEELIIGTEYRVPPQQAPQGYN